MSALENLLLERDQVDALLRERAASERLLKAAVSLACNPAPSNFRSLSMAVKAFKRALRSGAR